MPTAATRALHEVIEPVVRDAGAELEDVTVRPVGRRSMVRVVIDAPDGATSGLDLDTVADVSRAVADALDAADTGASSPLPDAYTLEVTTPGIDRPLTLPRHWRRAQGRLVVLERTGEPTVTARVRTADDDAVTLRTAKGEQLVVPYASVSRAVVEIEFGPASDLDDLEPDDDEGKETP
jgi:ribosome maturation factor RimP